MFETIDWISLGLVVAIIGQQAQIWIADKQLKQIGLIHDENMVVIARRFQNLEQEQGCCGGCSEKDG